MTRPDQVIFERALKHAWAIGIMLALVILGTSLFVSREVSVPKTSQLTYYNPGVPNGEIWGITNIQSIVQSPSWYEGSLCGGTCVSDNDYILNFGAQELVSLPGGSWNHYYHIQTEYIPGSGYAWIGVTPNGGQFGILHLSRAFGSFSTVLVKRSISLTRSHRDDTYKAFSSASRLPQGEYINGGQSIGYSGWPSSYDYSNGSCGDYVSCESDAHLCITASYTADQWFYYVSSGADKPPYHKPKPRVYTFHAKIWNAYRLGHHEKLIPYLYHKRFSWSASVWTSHQWLRGIRYAGHYYGGKHGYTKIGFAWADMYEFSWAHRIKIVAYKHIHR